MIADHQQQEPPYFAPPPGWQDSETETCGSLAVRVDADYFQSA
jgi:hypothetical protein